VPQLVVIVEVLIAQRNRKQALTDQGCDRMLDAICLASVAETASKPPDEPDRPVGCPQQQRASIRTDHAAVERAHNSAPFRGSEI
jgi:hypothetical protein